VYNPELKLRKTQASTICLLWRLKYLKDCGKMTRQGEIKGDNYINTTGRNWESFYSKVVASLRLISHIF